MKLRGRNPLGIPPHSSNGGDVLPHNVVAFPTKVRSTGSLHGGVMRRWRTSLRRGLFIVSTGIVTFIFASLMVLPLIFAAVLSMCLKSSIRTRTTRGGSSNIFTPPYSGAASPRDCGNSGSSKSADFSTVRSNVMPHWTSSGTSGTPQSQNYRL